MAERRLATLEAVWIAVLAVSTTARLALRAYEKPPSLAFVHQHSPAYAVAAIWACNSASAFTLATFSILHPALATAGIAYMALSADSNVVASWLAGLCPTQHLVYSVAESQAFILAAWLGLTLREKILRAESLAARWSAAARQTAKIACLVLASFLALAVLEVAEVLAYG